VPPVKSTILTGLLLLGSVFGPAACSAAETPRSPTPATTPPNSTGPGSAASATAAALDPCSLLTIKDISQYGTFRGPTVHDLGGAHSCTYLRNLASASDFGLTVSINMRDKQGVSTMNKLDGDRIAGKINGRDSVEAKAPKQGGCVVALAAGDTARVDVSVTSNDPGKACEVAEGLAAIIEPRMPKQ
jgi:hypothetical protein